MKDYSKSKNRGVILTFMAAALWGTSFPVIKWGLTYISAYNFVILRFLISVSVIVPITIILDRKGFLTYFKNKHIILLGFLNSLSYFLQFVGQQWTTATKTALLTNSSVIFAAILSYFWLKEKLGYFKASGIIVAFLGVFLIVTGGRLENLQSGSIIGDLFCLVSGVSWGFYIVISKMISSQESNSLSFISAMLTYTLLFILFFSLPLIVPVNFSSEVYFAILYTSIFCTILPFLLWYEGLKTIEASSSATYLLLTIIVAAIIGITLLSESFTSTLVFGALLICIGIWIVETK